MESGGNTTCVRVTLGQGQVIILDDGTGIRQLGNAGSLRAGRPLASATPEAM